jgi:hypothetical protein
MFGFVVLLRSDSLWSYFDFMIGLFWTLFINRTVFCSVAQNNFWFTYAQILGKWFMYSIHL